MKKLLSLIALLIIIPALQGCQAPLKSAPELPPMQDDDEPGTVAAINNSEVMDEDLSN